MSDAELNLDDLSAKELLATAEQLTAGLAGNENFPDPKPSLEELARLVAELDAARKTLREQRMRLNELKTVRHDAAQLLKHALAEEVAYVQEASGGDATKIMSANLHVVHKRHFWPFGSLDQVLELAATAGDVPGEIDLIWDPVPDAEGYEVEISDDVSCLGPWEQSAVATKSGVTLQHLKSRQRYWFRVRAVGEKGAGEWSDPVTKFTR